jgi:hypothetical protein
MLSRNDKAHRCLSVPVPVPSFLGQYILLTTLFLSLEDILFLVDRYAFMLFVCASVCRFSNLLRIDCRYVNTENNLFVPRKGVSLAAVHMAPNMLPWYVYDMLLWL